MLNLLLAIASSALVSITMRLSEGRTQNTVAKLMVNYLMCSMLSWLYAGSLVPQASGIPFALGASLINGVLYLAGFVLLQYNIRRNGVVLSSTFIKLGLLVSMIVSVVFFGERPGSLQWLGFGMALAAIVLMNFRPGEGKAGSAWWLLLLLLAGGGGDAMSKVFEELGNPALADHFLLGTFLTAFVLCALSILSGKSGKPEKRDIFFGLLIGIPNFFSAKFLLGALQDIAAVIVYPVYSVATILTVTLAGVLLFREKLEKRQWMALGIILLALVLLNL